LLESSHRDDSNKWSNIEYGEEIAHIESIEVNIKHLIWSFDLLSKWVIGLQLHCICIKWGLVQTWHTIRFGSFSISVMSLYLDTKPFHVHSQILLGFSLEGYPLI